MDGRTDGRPLDSHPISSPLAVGSGELKKGYSRNAHAQKSYEGN